MSPGSLGIIEAILDVRRIRGTRRFREAPSPRPEWLELGGSATKTRLMGQSKTLQKPPKMQQVLRIFKVFRFRWDGGFWIWYWLAILVMSVQKSEWVKCKAHLQLIVSRDGLCVCACDILSGHDQPGAPDPLHQDTDPSSSSAANAPTVAHSAVHRRSPALAAKASTDMVPPKEGWPQHTTEPWVKTRE